MFLEIPQNPQENTCARSFFNKVAGLRPATLLKKETLPQVYIERYMDTDYCEINLGHRQGVSNKSFPYTAWKMSVVRVFLVSVFSHLDWIRRFALSKWGKIRIRKTPNMGTFYAFSPIPPYLLKCYLKDIELKCSVY